MNIFAASLILILAATGCVTKSQARRQAQEAFFAGKKAALAELRAQSVTVTGPVQNPSVPWVAGLTLSQAIATANYQGGEEPRVIVITRQGESAAVAAGDLFNGVAVPLEPGDVIEIR
jgi:protein involved in polysaccharide export with SLBB domain